jgi:hypothetical protein
MARNETEKPMPKSAKHYMKNPNLTESEFTAHLGLDPNDASMVYYITRG